MGDVIVHYNTPGLTDLFVQFDDDADTAVPLVAGTGLKANRYAVTGQQLIDAELDAGVYSPTIKEGDYTNPSIDDQVIDAVEFDWNGTGIVTSKTGGGVLNAHVGVSALNQQDFLEIIQGEAKIVTIVVEANGRFDTDVFTSISVKVSDPLNAVRTITNENIERVTQELDVQVIRCTLSALDTAALSEGVLQIEISFDSQKARLTQAVKMIKTIGG